MKISLIIPVYNFGHRLSEKIEFLKDFECSFGHDLEIIFVNDGSTDGTLSILNSLESPFKVVNVEKNKGKGHAIKIGVSKALGDYIFFTDADIPYDLEAMKRALEAFNSGHDIVLGSRELPDSKSSCSRTLNRKIGSRIFSRVANFMFVKDIKDTQCGFKGFKREHAIKIFENTSTNGFSFDVEVIYLAQKMDLKINLISVHLIEDSDSSVHFFRDSVKMFFQLAILFWKLKRASIYQFVRYGITGVLNTILNIFIFNVLMISTNTYDGPLIMLFSIISFVFVITQAFFINAFWVFKKREHVTKLSYKKFFLVSGSVALVNIFIIHIIVNVIGAPEGVGLRFWANVAVFATIIISVLGNYLGYKFIVFK